MGRQQKKQPKARKTANSVQSQGGSKGQDENALLELGLEKIRDGKFKEAGNLLRRATRSSPKNPDTHLLLGIALYHQGKIPPAISSLEEAVKLNPQSPDAHFHLGNALVERGEKDAAAESYTQALSLRPDFAEAYRQLGIVMGASGILAQAVDCFNLALQFNPQDAESYYNLGLAQKAQGLAKEALESYARAVALDPNHAAAQVNLANIALDHGKLELAVKTYRAAIAADPKRVEAHSNLGKALKDLGQLEQSLEVCNEAVRLSPSFASAYNNRGNVLKEMGRLEEAVADYRKVIKLEPDRATGHYNLGDALHQLQNHQAAEKSYLKAIELDPKLAVAYNNLGLVKLEMGLHEEALQLFESATELVPEHDGYRCSYSRALLNNGFRKEALENAEACFRCGLRGPYRRFNIPQWTGEPLDGKTILIWREQGIGDEIEFAELYGEMIARAGKCIFEVTPRLKSIFERSFPKAEVRVEDHSQDQDRDDADYQISAGALCYILPLEEPETGQVPARLEPYMTPDSGLIEHWRERLALLPQGTRVGICWRSGLRDRLRDPHYTELTDWDGVLTLPGLNFINLQYDDCETEIRAAEEKFGLSIHRWADTDLKDDLETVFALVSQLDVVISAPTAVARIATSLGKAVAGMTAHGDEYARIPQVDLAKRLIHWRRKWDEEPVELMRRIGASLSLQEEISRWPESIANFETPIVQIMNAPRPKVFKAWLKSWGRNALLQKNGVIISDSTMEERPGGRFSFVAKEGSDPEMLHEGEFVEFVEPECLTYKYKSAATNDRYTEASIRFEEVGNFTKVSVMHGGLEGDITVISNLEGWYVALERLRDLVEMK